ncbi:SIR2 family NAD-dependent protein deacylase [Amycolatopsis pithecellobii]|uniref:protein acetyllysine N-acetyltransferase n=1 Tax=Amycolatopsis pithecellobii TaxID=664692 RepID=A0A6N7Z0V0_9PSEU|nr:Sir2 family NAD-dependent protein deacetylase [Amycolatopsis pithecellobii]MTD57928.1 NAD-dependent protein deacetylase [Amycolatopsis pithecellobii]
MPTNEELGRAARLIAGADALLVCAGAGMGVDSGLPDFRGDEGFWRAYPPYARLGLQFVELADPRHFAEDPALAWGFYGHRLQLYRETVPHQGFALLRKWSEAKPGGVVVFTSNVDGQFQQAGFPLVAEIHGSIHHLQCSHPCGTGIWPATDFAPRIDEDSMRATGPLPQCPACGRLARPNILMFGDFDWVSTRSDDQRRAVHEWRRRYPNLVVIELGAGTAVPTVRRYAELASAGTGALIRINPREPQIRHNRGISLAGGALDTLTTLDALLTAG